MKLDYSINSPTERLNLVNEIISSTPQEQLTPKYLEILADYLVFCAEKAERKKILTENRSLTINKRETSLEAIESSDVKNYSIYNLTSSSSKDQYLTPKVSITQEDLDTIPFLNQLRQAIKSQEQLCKTKTGKDAYLAKKALIEMRKDQYIIKQAYRPNCCSKKIAPRTDFGLSLEDNSYLSLDEKGDYKIIIQGCSLMNPKIIQCLLQNYSKLKQNSYDDFVGDVFYLMLSLENLVEVALKPFPFLRRILEMKIDGNTNVQIQLMLVDEFQKYHTPEYISALWCRKIPKVIAEEAQRQFLCENLPKSYFKQCTQCQLLKPLNRLFFTRNSSTKDGFYSICKECRKKKVRYKKK